MPEKKETHRVPQQKSTEWNECSTQPYEGAVLVRMNDGQSLVVNSSTDGSFSVDVPDGVAKVFVSAQGVAADLDIQPLLARREEEARRRLEEEAQRRAAAAAALAQAEREARAKEVANWPTVSVVPLLQGGADMMELIKRKNAAKGSWSLEDVMVGLTQGFQMMMAMQSMGASCLSAAGVKDFRLTLGGATGDKYQDEANCKSLMDSFYGDSIEFVSVNEIKVEPETLASLKKMRTFVEANAGKWAQEDYQDCYRSCLREKAFATQAHCDAVCRP